MADQYGTMTLTELKNAAKEKGIQGISTKKKQELIALLTALENTPEEKEKPKEEKKEQKTIRSTAEAENNKTLRSTAKTENNKTMRSTTEAENNKTIRSTAETENNKTTHGTAETENNNAVRSTAEKTAADRTIDRTVTEKAGIERKINHGSGQPDLKNGPERGRYERSRDVREKVIRPNYSRTNQERTTYQAAGNQTGNTGSYQTTEQQENPSYFQSQQSVSYPSRTQTVTNQTDMEQLDSGETKEGILEIMQEGFGFIRCDNFLPGDHDVYVAPMQIRRMNLKTGDIIVGNTKIKSQNEKFSALLYVKQVNGMPPAEALKRPKFEELTPIFPNSRIHLETAGCKPAMRMVDLISPIGKGQRGMIVSQPKAGKTTLLKQIAAAVNKNHPDMHMIILLIDERPEEVTDMKESIKGSNVEVIYSTFDELPENHKRVSEMVIERAKRLVEHGRDVIILLDSITRLARAYNLTVQASGRTLSGGLDPAALHMPKKFFGAARNMREGGSLTILATALVETGSRMDDVVFEEFKGTGNMELVLDRNLSERRVFPAIDLPRSSTRRDDLLLNSAELEANMLMRRAFNGMRSDDAVEKIIQMFAQTKSNADFIELIKKTKLAY